MSAGLALQYIKEMSAKFPKGLLLEKRASDVRDANLKEWNMRQFQLFQDLVSEVYVKRDDYKFFGNLGSFFYNFVESFSEYPNKEDTLDWLLTT
jgi:hypothetical protein